MRRKDLYDENEETIIDMTPMLDIVFIMLIFFIVTTSFVRETGMEVSRPIAKNASQKQKSETILVAITKDKEIWIDKRQIDVRAVRANIQKLNTNLVQPSVIIQADQESNTGLLVAVMDQIKMAGIENISIATQKK